jgi:hypothetical protein
MNTQEQDLTEILNQFLDEVLESDPADINTQCFADFLIECGTRLPVQRPDLAKLGMEIVASAFDLRVVLDPTKIQEFPANIEALFRVNLPATDVCSRVRQKALKVIFESMELAVAEHDYFWLGTTIHDLITVCLHPPAPETRIPVAISDSTIRLGRHTTVTFIRTLRIPEDGKSYPLPAGFGKLPIFRVEDYARTAPAKWLKEGGFFIPLYQREALYLEFGGVDWRPTILKVAVGRINAVTGKAFDDELHAHSQDYVVVPDQQWLDGINKGNGVVGQFIAMPLGEGYTVEELVTDEAKHGGFQLMAYDPMENRFADSPPNEETQKKSEYLKRHPGLPALPEIGATLASAPAPLFSPPTAQSNTLAKASVSPMMPGLSSAPKRGESIQAMAAPSLVTEMGIAAGGSIQQKIVVDKHGVESWDEDSATPLCIHIVNSEAFEAITGLKPPATPITAYSYKKRGIPWYSNYDESALGLPGAKAFQFIKSVFQIDQTRGLDHSSASSGVEISPEQIRQIHIPTVQERVSMLQTTTRTSFDQGRFEGCVRESTWLLDLVPNDSFALLMRANSYIRLEQYDLADMDATAVLQSHPRNVDAYLVRAYANLSSGWFKQAAKDAVAALELAPTNLRAKQIFDQALQSMPQ